MEENLERLVQMAAAAFKEEGAREVYLFGSAAHGPFRADSDFDFAVAGLPPENFFAAMGKAGDILGRPFDLVDLDENNPFTRYLKEEKELVRIS